ncbi:MAG: metallophosphoesterase, partial [Nanoarchaeota archaeon]
MNLVEALPGIEVADLALYLRKENILVIGDVHLGYEESMSKQGVFMPRFQFKDTIDRLGKIFSLLRQQRKKSRAEKGEKLGAVVVNGDLKHDFGSISGQEWRDILKFLDFILQYADDVILVKGNHDIKLAPIARKRGIVIVENIAINDKFICHGHEVPSSSEFTRSKIVIVGNEHPAVSL